MEECKAVASPVDVSFRLMSSSTASKIDVPFREAVGALMHLTTAKRPDIAYAVSFVSRFVEVPKKNTGLRSSASFATYKTPRCMECAPSQVQGSTFVAIRTQTGTATLLIASQRLDTSSCYWVLQ
uniref:Uncharacterized protein n=1 Tax=Peronospora matthiolae TaxID=2874970 RepID=A0AAV1VKD6_9STRA